jgi:hypothetical protein
MTVFKARIIQDYKEPKVEMYKPICVMATEDNLIQFNSHKNKAIKETRENKRKDQTKTQDITEFGLQCLRLRDSQPLKQF